MRRYVGDVIEHSEARRHRIEAGLLAHASLLLDDIDRPAASATHAQTAMFCADEAGTNPVLALSAQAKTARWQGTRRQGRERALYFARSARGEPWLQEYGHWSGSAPPSRG